MHANVSCTSSVVVWQHHVNHRKGRILKANIQKMATPLKKLSKWSYVRTANFIIIIPHYVVRTVHVNIAIVI